MKKLLATTALGASLVAMSVPAFAAGTPSYGSVKLTWSVNTSATMVIATNYSATGLQQTSAPGLLPSAAGVCTAGASETALNLTFGALTPSLSSPTACLYKNAVDVSVTSNDASGFTVNQYLDTALPTGIGLCAFPNGGASFPVTATGTVGNIASSRSGNPAAGTWAGSTLTCPAGSTAVANGTGGTLTNGGGGPGQPGGTGEYVATPTGGSMNWASYTTTAATAVWAGEDLQLNLQPAAASSAAQAYILTLQLIPA